MDLRDRDILWLAQWCIDWVAGETRTVRLQALAEHFQVTRRTLQYWLRRLQSDGWIEWQPQSGRGLLPQMTLQYHPRDHLQRLAVERIEQGRIDEALALVPESARGELLNYMVNSKRPPQSEKPGDTPEILFVPFYRAIHDLHPVTATRRTESHLLTHIHARLVEFDHQQQTILPSLAHCWRWDNKNITFYLRKGVQFHDGTEVNAFDVQRCLLELKGCDHGHAVHAESIRTIEVLDPWAVRLHLKRPNALLLHQLTLNCAAIYKTTNRRKDPIGCGQFCLTAHDSDKTVLTAFNGYFGYRALIDQVHFWTLKNQDINFDENAHLVNPGPRQRHSPSSAKSNLHAETGCSWLILNQRIRRGLFARFESRLALFGLLDFSTCPGLGVGQALRAYGFIPDRKTPLSSLQQEEGQQPAGLPSCLRVLTYQLTSNIELASWVCDCLERRGIQATLTVVPFPEFTQLHILRRYDIVVGGEVFDENILLSYFDFFVSTFFLDALLSTKRRRRLIAAAREVAQTEDSMRLRFEGLEDTCLEELLWIPIRHDRRTVLTSRRLHGQALKAVGLPDFGRVWLQ